LPFDIVIPKIAFLRIPKMALIKMSVRKPIPTSLFWQFTIKKKHPKGYLWVIPCQLDQAMTPMVTDLWLFFTVKSSIKVNCKKIIRQIRPCVPFSFFFVELGWKLFLTWYFLLQKKLTVENNQLNPWPLVIYEPPG
jgi:hypothetical protein